MITSRLIKQLAVSMLAASLGGAALACSAAETQPSPPPESNGWGYGPGMMGGGYGPGPGMMGRYGGGGQGYGWGMGHGMMGGGWGMGPGMMGGGYGWSRWLNLSVAQQAQVNKIQDETLKARWALMGRMLDERAKLRDLYLASKPDGTALKTVYEEIGKLREQMFDISVKAQERVDAVLTKEQREKLHRYRKYGCDPHR